MEGERQLRQGIAFLLFFGAFMLGWKIYRFYAPVRPMPFDTVLWRGPFDAFDANTPRSRMADNLIDQLPLGTPKAEVTTLLGAPDIIGAPCDYYLIGFRGDPIDPYSVSVCYDEEKRLTRRGIVQH